MKSVENLIKSNILHYYVVLRYRGTDLQSSPQSGRTGHRFGRQWAEEDTNINRRMTEDVNRERDVIPTCHYQNRM